MGLDMNMYAAQKEIIDHEQLWEETDLKTWYWRKANQIHNWMVNNVQGGTDDCGIYEVSLEKILDLHKEVTFAKATKDSSKLPPTAGFFFGSTEVDQWYWEELSDTQKYLEEMLDVYEDNPQTKFYYYASW